ncbi:MAG TPA: CarD family transcriptional regulator, partial [Aeromicrobium sp.]|nr:CarD family transcriptional regulator [Aeromicrobium sp.]
MVQPNLTAAVAAETHIAALVEAVRSGASEASLSMPPALYPFGAAALESPGSTVVVVTATARAAEDLVAAIGALIGPEKVAEFPAWETLPHERLSPRSDTVGRRLAVLRQVVHGGENRPRIVVAPVRSMMQPQVKGLADIEPVEVLAGQEVELDLVVQRLAAAAYSRVDLVERRGEFAVRGGIVDVFPPTEDHPIRVEFWGDTVEDVRQFAVADQRTLEPVDRLWAPPCRELLLTPQVRERAAELAKAHPSLAELFTKLSQGHAVEGMESLAPVLVGEMELFVDLLPPGSTVVVTDPERIQARAADLFATSDEFLAASWAAAAGGGEGPIDIGAAGFRELEEVRQQIAERELSWVEFSGFALAESQIVSAESAPEYRGDLVAALADIKALLVGGSKVVLTSAAHGPAQRSVEWLTENDVPAKLLTGPVELAAAPAGVVQVACAELRHGFVSAELALAVLTQDDLVGQRSVERTTRSMPSRRRRQVDPLELSPGDPVVHEQNGVARYVELVKRVVHGAEREYLVLEYAP